MSENNNFNLAIYVDGDNANFRDFSSVYNEIKKYGRIIIAKIYGDWTKNDSYISGFIQSNLVFVEITTT